MRNAKNNREKDEILRRLGKVWKRRPELRLMQLLSNVYGSGDPYYRQDFDAIEDVEDFYLRRDKPDSDRKQA